MLQKLMSGRSINRNLTTITRTRIDLVGVRFPLTITHTCIGIDESGVHSSRCIISMGAADADGDI